MRLGACCRFRRLPRPQTTVAARIQCPPLFSMRPAGASSHSQLQPAAKRAKGASNPVAAAATLAAAVAADLAGLEIPAPPPSDLDAHVARAWKWWESIGAPKYHVAPMVDQSELAFRLLCRRNGATCAYTPMMHARLFAESPGYRAEQFSTTPDGTDRPLLAQFCGNDPATVLAAARILERRGCVDAVDLNLGCPQRIARRGKYGAFLMDHPETVSEVVSTLAAHLSIPVTAKMRVFSDLDKTVSFARMLESSGASLVAVHGRTRDAKDAASVRADWRAIAAVKRALRVPVLANGDVLCLSSAEECLRATGADGVLSAIPLLEDPALFSEDRGDVACKLRPIRLLKEYCVLAAEHETPARMVRGHAFRMLGDWLGEHTDLRDALNGFDRKKGAQARREEVASAAAAVIEGGPAEDEAERLRRHEAIFGADNTALTPEKVSAVCDELLERIRRRADGRVVPRPVVTERAALRAQKAEEARAAAIEEAEREERALASIGAGFE